MEAPDPNKKEAKENESLWRQEKRCKYLVDENLGEGTAWLLRDEWKANVEFAPDVGLSGKSDTEVFAYAWKKCRILITHDRGFLNDRRFPEHRNPGVAVLPGGSGEMKPFYQAVNHMMALMERAPWRWQGTKVVFGDNGEVTIKQRNVQTGVVETLRYRFTRHGDPDEWVSAD